MGKSVLAENIWTRGWRDTKAAVKSFWFWVPEAGGTAVIGIFDPVLAAVFFFGLLAAVWVGATAGAPFKQRNEARIRLNDLEREQVAAVNAENDNSDWLTLANASRIYRDLLDKYGVENTAAVFDFWGVDKDDDDPALSYTKNFIYHIMEGVNEAKILKVRGRPINGQAIIDVPTPLGEGQNSHENLKMLMVTGADGRAYTDVTIQRASIEEFAKWKQDHDEL